MGRMHLHRRRGAARRGVAWRVIQRVRRQGDVTCSEGGSGLPARDGHLVVAIQYDAQAFNDAYRYFTGHGGYFVCNNIYSRLVVLDVFENGTIGPDLAERWESPDNGQTWRFYLNPQARWHDGVPVTAHDVAHTYTTVLARGYAGKTFLSDIETTTALDDHTVEIRCTHPTPPSWRSWDRSC